MEEEARYRQEQRDRRWKAGEHVPLTERVKEMVGSR
jgi:hypothetical protein